MDVAELRAKARNGGKLLDCPPPPGVRSVVWQALEALMGAHLRALDRIEALEAAHRVRGVWRGTWKGDGTRYSKGDLLTDRGSLWHCNRDTAERPGTSPAWTLAVKRGESNKLQR